MRISPIRKLYSRNGICLLLAALTGTLLLGEYQERDPRDTNDNHAAVA